jgi:cytochrome b561
MQLTNSKIGYGAIPQLIHWLTALFVIAGWLLGQFGDALPRGSARALGLSSHITLGQCIFALVLVRVIWRVANPPPPPETTPLGKLLELAAKVSHFALYALLLAIPVLGIIVQLKRGHSLPVFGVWDFASPWPADRETARSVLRIHYYLANALLILVGIHACAALTHHWIWYDRTLRRMLPGAAG